MNREEEPVPPGGTREGLVAGLHADFAEVPVETVRRCIDDLWSCCVHLGIRPEAGTIESLALSRLAGIVKGACAPGGPAGRKPPPAPRSRPVPRSRRLQGAGVTAVSASTREMTR